jgi:acetyl esterase/lipase
LFVIIEIAAPSDPLERGLAAFLRGFLVITFRSFIGPKLSIKAQRSWVQILALLTPGRLGLHKHYRKTEHLEIQVFCPKKQKTSSVVLYLHGGAFCLGNSYTHRGICSHLAYDSGLDVWVPNYRLSPENPYPAPLEDALLSYETLLKEGYSEKNIVIAGDSAGASLALALVIALQGMGKPTPACAILISPVTNGGVLRKNGVMGGRNDPILNMGWLDQGIQCFNPPKEVSEFSPLNRDLAGLPPLLIQVAQEEILLNDSLLLEKHAINSGLSCRLELYLERWHVFHLQAFYLRSSKAAIQAMSRFALSHLPK